MVAARPASAVDQVHDEIQVYNAEIAEVGNGPTSNISTMRGEGRRSRSSRADSFRTAACKERRSLLMG
jgi:hypothetical protein